MKYVLCGVAGSRETDDELRQTVSRMSGDSGAAPEILAGIGMAAAARTCRSGPIIAAYAGTPRWTDSGLADIHSRSGFAESLAEAWRRLGFDCMDSLRGAFAIAVLDGESREGLLAVDRMGIHQLYYCDVPGAGLVFANSAACLLRNGHVSVGLDHQAIYHYLYFHMVPSPGSIFEGIRKLGPGDCLAIRNGDKEIRTYWSPHFEESASAGRAALEDEVREILGTAVERCSAFGETGSFLSGGIDSSTIAGLLAGQRPPARTFTIGFDEEGYDETGFARVTASHFDTRPQEYFVSAQDVVDILPQIAATYDEPFGNSSVVPTYFCARMARDSGIDTLLAGDGGDELFGGNVRYVTQQVFGLYDNVPGFLKRALIEPLAFGIPGTGRFPPTRKLQSYIRQARLPMPDRLETYNYFQMSGATNILHPDMLDVVDVDGPIELQRRTYGASTADSMLNRMLQFDWKFTLADNDLRKVCAMCDLAGIGVQYPFLDDDLVEFSTRVPAAMKIRRFRLRDFFKRAMRDFLPAEVLSKSKHGFGLPFGIWMNSYAPLKELAYDCLTGIRGRNIVNAAYLDELIEAHRDAHAHFYGEFIWVLMMLELWFRSHGHDQSAAAREAAAQ